MSDARGQPRTSGIEGAWPSFLIGPALYLRAVESRDAETFAIWHPSPFPLDAQSAEERLKRDIPSESRGHTYRLVICARTDDRPVGSVLYEIVDGRNAWCSIHTDPRLPDRHGEVTAEALTLMIPWLVRERDLMSVWFVTEPPDDSIAAAIQALGMRFAYRLREAIWREGQRLDQVVFEALHPIWVEKLGMPPQGEDFAVPRHIAAPAPSVWSGRESTPPERAIVVGNRIYLAPIEQAAAEEIARWSMRETETAYDQGRHIRSPISYAHWTLKNAEQSPPEWLRLAIVDRRTDVVIGAGGIAQIDWLAGTGETEMEIVRPTYRGNGYGTEAKHLLLGLAFDRWGLHAVRSNVWSFNHRSCAALRKQGYRDAGRMAWTGIKHGEFVDDQVFDLLASDWRAARR